MILPYHTYLTTKNLSLSSTSEAKYWLGLLSAGVFLLYVGFQQLMLNRKQFSPHCQVERCVFSVNTRGLSGYFNRHLCFTMFQIRGGRAQLDGAPVVLPSHCTSTQSSYLHLLFSPWSSGQCWGTH